MVEPHALFETFVGGVVVALEAAAALVILIAGAKAFWGFLARTVRRAEGRAAHRPLRHDFGRSLLLALDFAIGSDVLRVALAPSFQGVAIAGLVVLVRTVLTLVLEFEMRKEETKPDGAAQGPPEGDEGRARTRRGGQAF